MRELQVRLLGRFSVTTGERAFDLQTGLAHLLAYLSIAYGRPLLRSRVAGTLWPDVSEDRARANLSNVAWRLRQALVLHGFRREIIRAKNESLMIDPDRCDLDIEHFRQDSLGPGTHSHSLDALSRAVNALGLYKGDLLEDWDVEWCRLERESLKQRYMHTLRALAEAFERRGRLDLALQYANQAVEADPFSETGQRMLIRLFSHTGDRGAAINQFNRFVRLSRSELGAEPDRETIALLHEIRGGQRASSTGPATYVANELLIRPERVPVVGREEEQQLIGTLMHEATDGNGGGVLLLGDAGIGKSRLAEWAMEEWAAHGGTSVRGRCVEFNEPVPYQPVLDALESYVGSDDIAEFVSAARLTSHPTTLDDVERDLVAAAPNPPAAWPSGKLRFFNWLRTRLDEMSRRRPLLMIIEDLQWADAGTIDFLAHLLERSRSMRLAMLLTSRPTESQRQALATTERLSRYCAAAVRLGPLSKAETFCLVQLLLESRAVAPNLTTWVYAEAEGNPLFIVETLRLLQQQGRIVTFDRDNTLDVRSSNDQVVSSSIPDGVRSAVRQRLSLLDLVVLRVAETASVLGRSFDEETLLMIARTGRNGLSRSIEHLLRAGVFERENAGYRFSHDKIRAVCYENLPTALRRSYHARAAAILSQVPDVPLHRLAWHESSAGQWHLAATSWVRAGDQARDMYAYEEALRAYTHSISCIQLDKLRSNEERTNEEIGLLKRSDQVLAILGRPTERNRLLERMGLLCRRASKASFEATWFIRRALLEEYLGNFRLAAKLARRAWCLARVDRESEVEIEALCVLAEALNRGGRHTRSLAVSRLVLKRIGETHSNAKVHVLREAARVHVKMSEYASAMSCLDLAKGTQIAMGHVGEDPHILVTEAVALKWSGDLLGSRTNLTKAELLTRSTGDLVLTARIVFQLATLDALEGKFGDSLRKLREASVASRLAGHSRTYIACLNEVANGVGRLIGNYEWAWKASSRARELARSCGSDLLTAVCRDSQVKLLFDEGRLQEAIVAIGEVLEILKLQRGSFGPNQESLARRGAILLGLGRLFEAITDLESARRFQAQKGDRLVLVDTLTNLALAYARLGHTERAHATSDEAVRLLSEIGYANLEPQRVYWHHYLIIGTLSRGQRIQYLRRAVDTVNAQAATLSKAQARRLRQDVCLNREILESWSREQEAGNVPSTGSPWVPDVQPAAAFQPMGATQGVSAPNSTGVAQPAPPSADPSYLMRDV